MFAQSKVVLIMAAQNLLLHRLKTLVVGGILFFGSFLLCLGLTLTQNVEKSMAESIQGSLAGDLQLYDRNAKDKLALFGGTFFGREELGVIPDWPAVARVVAKVPGVKATVPMGFEGGFIGQGNAFDNLFQKLREYAYQDIDKQKGHVAKTVSPEHEDHILLVRKNLEVLKRDVESELAIAADKTVTNENISYIDKALSDDFWAKYKSALTDSSEALENALLFLDTKIAPISGEKPPIYLRYMGTEVELYAKSFSRFALIKGELPKNTPGEVPSILLPERFYETEVKNLVAVTFDKINEGMRLQGLKPAENANLAAQIKQLPDQYMQIVLAISPQGRNSLAPQLRQHLGASDSTPFESLVKDFLTINENNALERHDFFYEHIAPLAKLHSFDIGETIFLRAYTRAGFLKTLALKISGIYRFEGLSRSDLAGATSIISLESYRELYGVMSQEGRKELDDLSASVKVTGERSLENAASLEDSLFGVDAVSSATPSETQGKVAQALLERRKVEDDTAPMAINIAVLLNDNSKIRDMQVNIERALADHNFALQVVDWKSASGIVGQLVTALTVVIFVSVLVIVVVGVAIINNSLMMSTLERIREIGTLRAIGAGKGFITTLFLSEITLLASAAVYSGALASIICLGFLHSKGIPATSDFVVFLFSGPRLYPTIYPMLNFVAASALLVCAVMSSAFPARFASRIEPAVAMQEKE